jgi:hypothetical protein
MSAIKRSDVQNHLRPPFLAKIHLVQPEIQTDATGFFAVEPDIVQIDPSNFAEDFVAEHSSSGTTLVQDNPQGNYLIGSIGPHAPATSKRVQS